MSLLRPAATQDAVAEGDTFDHERRFGVPWPVRAHEEVVPPLRLQAHDWQITELDFERGYDAMALRGPVFGAAAVAPAASVSGLSTARR